jgi:murein DD-endopeptidase MepM/ murein hydrolase activator NlpD
MFSVVIAALFLGVAGEGDIRFAAMPTSSCSVIPQLTGDPKNLTEDQRRNARTIIDVGRELKVPPRGWTIALMAALQESSLDNIPFGDRDSVGLFQQRDAWGPFDVRMDPTESARMFYTGGRDGQPGLLDTKGWQGMPLGAAAQAVERSAFPFAYDKHEGMAAALVTQLAGADPGECGGALAPGDWRLPTVPGYHLTSRFGSRIHPVRNTLDFHTGLDFAAPLGSPVYAASAGRVVSAGWGGGYGNLLRIAHADGVQTWYAHLSGFLVGPGDLVATGQEVARVGVTGNSTGPHLHFEVRLNGTPRDPEPWLPEHGVPLAGDPAGGTGRD